MTSFPRKDYVVFIGRCCQSMPFERQRLKCVMQEWRQVAKVANEQVIRQLVNTCPGKITLVHLHHQRTPQRLFKHMLGWVILVRCDIANQVIATGKEGWRKVLRKKSAAISERSIAKILRHWFKLATWGHYFAYLSLIGMGVVQQKKITGLATKITFPFRTINWVQFEKILLAKFCLLAWLKHQIIYMCSVDLLAHLKGTQFIWISIGYCDILVPLSFSLELSIAQIKHTINVAMST